MTPRSVSAAETDETVFLETNLQLVDFYIGQGIEFLGESAIGKEIVRAGARFAAPLERDVGVAVKRNFQAVDFAVPFRAARALLEKEQAEVAEAVGLTVAVIQNLERGKMSREPQELLRSWYETNGVEFTGWGDIATGRFYGVGVRWAT
ncbi:helix-turn-helix domain-containing protein [Sinorhizobium meliloti]|uniref:helix-turn-helix domain-containing protein n=1 Tax=Rhizobium meliloti TaxID=382 RepID=UPI001F25463F|nr:helix-turn-helix transcriptional regulator [Sinorhizobium meliloti]